MSAPSLGLTERYVKRSPRDVPLLIPYCERAIAATALAAAAPVLIGVLAAVRALSGRSPLIAHKRIGLGGEPFWMFKVRTMWGARSNGGAGDSSNAWIEYLEQPWVPIEKQTPDPRVTIRFAAWCRRYSLDELPQLLHVLRGQMRLVGPRPLTREELDGYYGPQASAEVLSVRPGITGLWQVIGRNKLTYPQRRRLDLFFVRKASLALWTRILLRTPGRVLGGHNAW